MLALLSAAVDNWRWYSMWGAGGISSMFMVFAARTDTMDACAVCSDYNL